MRVASLTRSMKGQRSRAMRVVCEATTQVKRNKNIQKLQAGYLFPEIARRRNAHQEANPDAKLISLGIGDTTEPIPPYIVNGLMKGAEAMGTLEGYKGYGPEQGYAPIREAIFNRLYANTGLTPNDIYVSDGSKCDIGRMQMMFGEDVTVALQDPAYPVYVDSSVIMGMTGDYNGSNFDGITYMECRPENDFFPDLSKVPRTDIIFFCSPNNPTGSAATREQLTELVNFARKNGSIIVYDAAYALFIEDETAHAASLKSQELRNVPLRPAPSPNTLDSPVSDSDGQSFLTNSSSKMDPQSRRVSFELRPQSSMVPL
eukprot:jgi/Picre1/30611/NNA_005972.t1